VVKFQFVAVSALPNLSFTLLVSTTVYFLPWARLALGLRTAVLEAALTTKF
jgi:hypothetical protein